MKHSKLLEYEPHMVLSLLLAFLVASVTGLFLGMPWISGIATVVCLGLFFVLLVVCDRAFIASHQEDVQ